ncbi:MAG: transposase [Candidatus Verstraetearchaeota archaeon]|nr:transposase [Candidatus Verstraetearchaeota archaeon]
MPRESQNFSHEIALEAEEEFKKLKEGKLATQLRAIMAFEDNTAEQIAKIFKVSVRTVFRWINKFSQYGIEGLKDRPKGHYQSKLTEDQKDQIKSWIKSGKNSKNEPVHWTLEKLKAEVAEVFNVEMTTTALWKNLDKLGLTLKKPRPVHHKADKEAQAAFKKNS